MLPLGVARLWGAPVELLSNGGFERVKDGVPAGCSVQHPFASVEATAEARSGKTAALLRLPKSSESSWVYIGRVPVKVGARYRGEFWAKGHGRIDLLLPQYASRYMFLGSRAIGLEDGALAHTWRRYSFTYRTDDRRVSYVAIAVRLRDGTSVHIDDASFTFDPAENPRIRQAEPEPTMQLRIDLVARDAEVTLYCNGENVAITGSAACVTLREGLSTLAVEACATGQAPGVRFSFPGHPEADRRWRVSTDGAGSWREASFDDSAGGWRVALPQSDGYLWNWNLGAKRAHFRQTLLWTATHYGPNFCIHPRVKHWGFAQESLETLCLALYSPLTHSLDDYELTLDIPAEFRLLDTFSVVPRFQGNRDNTPPVRVGVESIARDGMSFSRHHIFYAKERVPADSCEISLLPIQMTRRFPKPKCKFYFRRSAQGSFTELEQTLPIDILPRINGRIPAKVTVSQYNPVSVFCSPEHLAALIRQNTLAGSRRYTLALNRAVEAIRPDVADYMALLQNLILANDGEVVFLPDSSHPLYGAGLSPALSRGYLYDWVKRTPAAQARFFKDIAPWGAKYFHFYSMYCPSFVTAEGAPAFREAVQREYADMLSGYRRPQMLFLDWEVEPWRERVRPTDTYTHARWCFCNLCKEAFREFAGLPVGADLSDDTILLDHRLEWSRFRRAMEGKIQHETLKVAHAMGMSQLLYSGDAEYFAACRGHLDHVFVGCPGNSVADSHYQMRLAPGKAYQEASGIRQIVGQRFSYSVPRRKGGWKGSYNSYDGFHHPKSWKTQVVRVTAWMHGGVDLANLAMFGGGAHYYIGEATRLIAEFEQLFWDGERADELASAPELPPGNLIVLRRDNERLVLLFNEAAAPRTVTLANRDILPGQTGIIYGTGARIARPETMAVTIPPEDVAAVHIK